MPTSSFPHPQLDPFQGIEDVAHFPWVAKAYENYLGEMEKNQTMDNSNNSRSKKRRHEDLQDEILEQTIYPQDLDDHFEITMGDLVSTDISEISDDLNIREESLLIEDDAALLCKNFLETGHPNGVRQAVECSRYQKHTPSTIEIGGYDAVLGDSNAFSYSLSQIQAEYAASRFTKSRSDKYSEQLWNEFGEIIKTAAATSGGTAELAMALEKEWRHLTEKTRSHDDQSGLSRALEIVQGRQKRRQTKQERSSGADSKCKPIQPWHIVLGERSSRNRTLATLILRFYCFQLKQCNRRINSAELLDETRCFLERAFPRQDKNDIGRILYVTGSRFAKDSTKTQEESLYAFGIDNKNTFSPVSPKDQHEAVKLLYTKISASERSLEDLTETYSIALEGVRKHAPVQSIQSFKSLLDFVSQAGSHDLTQTAINGLRESLDTKWGELFGGK